MVVNTQINADQVRALIASVYRCELADVVLGMSDPPMDLGDANGPDELQGLASLVTATVKTDLDGAKRAAKILNAGKA